MYTFKNKVVGPPKATVSPTNALETSVSMRLQINIQQLKALCRLQLRILIFSEEPYFSRPRTQVTPVA